MIKIEVKDIHGISISDNDKVYLMDQNTEEIDRSQIYVFKIHWNEFGEPSFRFIKKEELESYLSYKGFDKYVEFEIIKEKQ
jgi:hypothetical protein